MRPITRDVWYSDIRESNVNREAQTVVLVEKWLSNNSFQLHYIYFHKTLSTVKTYITHIDINTISL